MTDIIDVILEDSLHSELHGDQIFMATIDFSAHKKVAARSSHFLERSRYHCPVWDPAVSPSYQSKKWYAVCSGRPGRLCLLPILLMPAQVPVEHNFELLEDTSIYFRPKLFPILINDVVEEELSKFWSRGTIKRSKYSWAFPILAVKKKDWKPRFRIDSHPFNRKMMH